MNKNTFKSSKNNSLEYCKPPSHFFVHLFPNHFVSFSRNFAALEMGHRRFAQCHCREHQPSFPASQPVLFVLTPPPPSLCIQLFATPRPTAATSSSPSFLLCPATVANWDSDPVDLFGRKGGSADQNHKFLDATATVGRAKCVPKDVLDLKMGKSHWKCEKKLKKRIE